MATLTQTLQAVSDHNAGIVLATTGTNGNGGAWVDGVELSALINGLDESDWHQAYLDDLDQHLSDAGIPDSGEDWQAWEHEDVDADGYLTGSRQIMYVYTY